MNRQPFMNNVYEEKNFYQFFFKRLSLSTFDTRQLRLVSFTTEWRDYALKHLQTHSLKVDIGPLFDSYLILSLLTVVVNPIESLLAALLLKRTLL